jgi:RNA polymerase sigma-B factor
MMSTHPAPMAWQVHPGSIYGVRSPREIEQRLFSVYHETGDVRVREELARRFLPLARDLALRYTYTDEPFDDLLQVASLGLIKAIDRFEPERGSKFTSYAAPTILGEIKRHFRDKGWALHVPRELQERTLKVTRETERLSKELGRSPTVKEIAFGLGTTPEKVLEAAQASGAYEAASLDTPTAREDGESAALVEQLGSTDVAYDLVESRDAIATAWQALPDAEQSVLKLRFMDDLTQREIGERIGYSQMHVSRLLRRALTRLDSAAEAA